MEHGRWCDRRGKTIGEGDIAASYSADRIGMDQPIRKPFEWRAATWVCLGTGPYRDVHGAIAIRLADPCVFDGTPVAYREKTRNAEAARADPNGFSHGMSIKHAKGTMVLCGPPVLLIPGQSEQLDLFLTHAETDRGSTVPPSSRCLLWNRRSESACRWFVLVRGGRIV